MSLERYSIGVDIDQSGINAGTQQMITTLNNATATMKASLTQLAANVTASMQQITNTMSTNSQLATVGTTNAFNTMNTNISNGTKQASASIQQSAQQMTTSLNALQSSLNGLNLNGLTSSANSASGAIGNLSNAKRACAASTSFLSDKMRMLRQHLEWIATGAFLTAFIGLPGMMIKAAEETETLNQKIRQNLELSDQYHNNNQQLDTDLGKLTETAKTFAVGYGADLKEVMESMQILSRRFKDVESIAYLTSAALTMNKLDFVDLKKASADLEAVMLQFGLTAQGTERFVNDFSIAVHVARINGTDLLDALQRSGAAFKGFNMDAREAIAAVSALSTETARTGSTIGNTMKSITANFNMKKAVEALKAYDIQLYDTNEQGMKVMRSGANVFAELQTLYARLDDEGKGKLSLAIAGGKFQVNAMQAFLADANQNFSKILGEMNDKSSSAMTKQLMQTGMDTFANKMAQLKASIQVFAQTIGSKMLPMLKDFADRLTASVIWIQQHNDSIMTAIGWVGKLAEAYLIIKGATMAYAVASGIVTIYTGLQAIATAGLTGTVALATIGTWAQNAANIAATASAILSIAATEGLAAAFTALWAAMGPIGWVILAITALGVAIYEIYTNWEPILQWMKDMWNKVVNFIADHILLLTAMFPVLGISIIIISTYWKPIIQWMEDRWAGFVWFFNEVKNMIIKIIDGICEAMPKFATSAGEAISNMANILATLVYNFLPQWGKDVINFFSDLGTKLHNITKAIGDNIRKNLSITGINDGGGVGDVPYGPQQKEKTPLEIAQELAEENLRKAIAANQIHSSATSDPDLNNRLQDKTKKEKKTPASETAYAIAKREYQAEIADEELTATEKIAIYKRLLEGKAVGEKELHDYTRGLGKLEVQEIKEARAIKNAQLDLEIAEGKEKNADYFKRKIELLQEEVNNCKAGSVERIQAEIKVAEAKKELVKFEREQETQKINQAKQTSLDLVTQEEAKNKKLVGLYQMTQEEYTRTLLKAEADRYAIELKALEDKKKLYAGDEKEAAKVQTEITKLMSTHAKTKLGIEADLYKQTHQYQLAALEGFRTGMKTVLNGLLQWNMSVKQMVRELGKAILTNLGDVWVNGVVERMSKGFAKMLGLTTEEKAESLLTEETKQSSLTGVAAAGEKTRLLATKTSIMAAGAMSAAGASAMVGATVAAFTATIAMISATATALMATGPVGAAIGSAELAAAGVAMSTLTAAGATATASIAAFSVPSFAVGAWKLGKDQLAMVHEGETILPKEPAQQFRDFVSNSDMSNKFAGGGGGGDQFHISVPLHVTALDAKGVEKVLVKQSNVIGRIVQTQVRDYKYKKGTSLV